MVDRWWWIDGGGCAMMGDLVAGIAFTFTFTFIFSLFGLNI